MFKRYDPHPGGGCAHSEQIAEFFEAVDEVIVKPTGLSSGRGIFKLTEKEFLADQQRYLEQFFRDGVLLEECVRNHDDLQALNPNVLNTVRVYTMTDAQNQVHILDAMLRIGQGGGVVDNFHNNGVICRIDLDTGVLCTNGMDIDGLYHNVNSYTGKPYIGVTIPRWDELKRFVLDAAMVIPSARYVAWDVAVTPDGFEMIEGNYEPYTALLQMFEKRGVYRTMMGMR